MSKRAKHPHTDQSTYAGLPSKPVQVNFTEEQKKMLVKRCRESGTALAVYIRTAAVEKASA